MNKTLKNNLLALDNTPAIVYNNSITSNDNKGTKTMTLARFMNYILYTDKRPENISAARWCAMRVHAEKNMRKV